MIIKIKNSAGFKHHRCGWNFCIKILEEFHSNNGILCLTYADGAIGEGEEIDEPWIGFFHNTPTHPEYHSYVYPPTPPLNINGANSPLCKLRTLENFNKSLEKCKGIFTLCEYTANFMKNKLQIEVPINVLTHPIEDVEPKFNYEQFLNNEFKTAYTIGHWVRNFQSTYDINCPYTKTIIDVKNVLDLIPIVKNDSVQVIKRLSNPEYDMALSKNIVFMDLYDAAACNGVIDCIIRNTPLITRRFQASEEYLGKDYPLFFDDIKDVNSLFELEKIKQGHEYLMSLNKLKFTKEKFKDDFLKSSIIKNLTKKFRLYI